MKTIEINGISLTLTEETYAQLMEEMEEKKAEARRHWVLWHWYARRWAMYGNKDYDGSLFSDLYKDENGCRPYMNREEIFWFLDGREVWIQHGRH